ncbi:hypothetical protein [Pseudarthrobacter sp. CCNWLW207]|uniref:hypothetical protein n=1 Tax=Pseudarthrobacter sp. CCNWLW207 TaxID=3127468 RepID=UPI0030788B15
MDASSSQEKIVEPPRHLFFGVEDRRLGGRAGLTDKHIAVEKTRRHQLAEHVINSAIQVTNAVRTMRTFDRTGNADQVLDHLSCSLEDLVKQTNNLIAEVEKSVDRYGDGLEELAARDAAEAAADLNRCAHSPDKVCDNCEPAHIESHLPAVETPAAATPTPQALAAAGPKPGPRPIAVVNVHNADDVAQVKANLGLALDRISR